MKDNLLYSYVEGDLKFGLSKKSLSDIVKNYTRPVYIYDLAFIGRQVDLYRSFLPEKSEIFYAVKANANSQVLRFLKSKGVNVDVVSGGEIKCALDAGFTGQQIIFSGVGKTQAEIDFAFDQKIFQINVESLSELKRIIRTAQMRNQKVDVAVRINPDISVDTHPYISTGLNENKFGLELDQLDDFAALLNDQTHVQWRGLSVHLGSQIFDIEPLRTGLKTLIDRLEHYRKQFPQLSRVDLGGGLGIDYHEFDFEREKSMLKEFGAMVSELLQGRSFDFMIEPGRSLVGHAGVLVTQIQYIKRNKNKLFVITDSGMNHLMRPALYQAYHQILTLKKDDRPGITCDVVGPICETSDFFAKNCELDHCEEGDFIAVCDVGAYGFSMANRYNQKELPTEICINLE